MLQKLKSKQSVVGLLADGIPPTATPCVDSVAVAPTVEPAKTGGQMDWWQPAFTKTRAVTKVKARLAAARERPRSAVTPRSSVAASPADFDAPRSLPLHARVVGLMCPDLAHPW